MREIKFRVWNVQKKRMSQPFDVFSIYTENCNQFAHQDDIESFELGFKEEKVMQFTGLKDKNGKEIYEGDIIESKLNGLHGVDNYTRIVGEVYFEDILYSFVINAFDAGSQDKQLHKIVRFFPINYQIFLDRGIKVIGNIYENPELLK